MKKLLKYVIPALIVGTVIAIGAHAQVVNPQWKINAPSSTIAPINPSLQVPCANIVGGCGGGGGISTSTTNTFSVPQNFTGINNAGTVTSTNIVARNINTILNVPVNFATLGCNGSSTLTDFGACVNNLYASGAAASSVTIMVPVMTVASSSWRVPINFGTNGERVNLLCQGVGSVLNYGGATSTAAVTINTNNVNAAQAVGSIVSGCNFSGTSATTTNPTTGILLGGVNGAIHTQIIGNNINNFGIGLNTASNTYATYITNNTIVNNGENVLINSPSNSGEGMDFFDNFIVDPGNSSSSNCFVAQNNAAATLSIFGGSFDDCQLAIGTGNLAVTLTGVHFENPSYAQYGNYPFITLGAGSSLSQTGGVMMNDSTSTGSQAQFIKITGGGGGYFNSSGVSGIANGTSTTNYVFASGVVSIDIQGFSNSQGFGVLGLVNGSDPNVDSFTMDSHAAGIGGIDTFAGDSSSSVDTPFIVSHKAANSGQLGSYTTYGVNAYVSANNSIQLVNTSTKGWMTVVDSRNNTNPLFQIESVNTSSVATTMFAMNASGSTAFGNAGIPGCLEFYDSVNSSTKEYIYTASNVLTSTTTKPAFCQ